MKQNKRLWSGLSKHGPHKLIDLNFCSLGPGTLKGLGGVAREHD